MTSNDNFKIKFNSQIPETQSGESAKAEKKLKDILISFNFDGNLKLDYTKIEFAFVTKKGLDEDIKTAKNY